jgi:hypothetical protein
MAQSFFALEVVVERSFGDVGGGENSIDPGALEPVSVNLAKRCLQQALSRALSIAQLCRPALQLLRGQQHTDQYVRGVAQEVKRIICRPIRVPTTNGYITMILFQDVRPNTTFSGQFTSRVLSALSRTMAAGSAATRSHRHATASVLKAIGVPR